MKLSAVIITYNEEKNISRCLDSLQGVADEIIVVDSFSYDHTEEICKKYNAHFVQKEWMGYSSTKNFANSLSTNEYILSIDADEELSEELKKSILEIKSHLQGSYSVERLNNYCGKWIFHGGWYPDIKVRIFSKNEIKWDDSAVHEKPEIGLNKPMVLKGKLHHYSYYTINEHKERSKKYAELAAAELREKPIGFLLIKLFTSPILRFIKFYILKAGFLDGYYGLVISLIVSQEVWYKYMFAFKEKKSRNKAL